jgi:multidrug efflux pump subunit AcrA (membrane-fusion protein)
MRLRSSSLSIPLALLAGACDRHPAAIVPSANASAISEAPAATVYYCPMHTDYRSDRPGNCPICNMKLVPLRATPPAGGAGEVSGRAATTIPVDLQKRIGLATEVVDKKPFSRVIRAAARVEADERKLSAVSLRYGGWIEDLQVRAVGDLVRPGDPLLSIYSPELYEAQRTYLATKGALPETDEAVKSSRQRLSLWDMTEEQIRALEARGEPETRTTVLAKVGGFVTRRDALLGMRFEAGATLYEIADLSTLWVIAEVYEPEIPLVKVGVEARIEFASSPGERVPGRIRFVYPTISDATRTARVRIEIDNADLTRRPAEYATVEIAVDLGEQLLVDVDAVIDSGTRKIVFVQAGEDRFEPREVTLGPRSGGRAVVLSGLAAGERVVSSATFLVDSESRLKSAVRAPVTGAAEGPSHAGHAGHTGH